MARLPSGDPISSIVFTLWSLLDPFSLRAYPKCEPVRIERKNRKLMA